MTFLSFVALAISIGAIFLLSPRLTLAHLGIFAILLIIHLGASVYYYNYTLTSSADASVYYFDPYGYSVQPFHIGTMASAQICAYLKNHFSASYLDCFILFQIPGFVGILILAKSFSEIQNRLSVPEEKTYLALLFLPSLNFWTSAIGKDAPVFLGISLCVWALLRLRRRMLYFALGLGLIVVFRAHIALIVCIALALSAVFDRSMSIAAKLGLLVMSLVGMYFLAGAVESTLDLDVSSVASVADFLNQHNNDFATVPGTTSLGNAPLPARIISLLFRPFFFDAHGLLGLVASIENIGVILMILYFLRNVLLVGRLVRRVFFLRFAIILGVLLLISLTLVYYNVGLGLRERVMAYPPIFCVLISIWSMRRRRFAAQSGSATSNPLSVNAAG